MNFFNRLIIDFQEGFNELPNLASHTENPGAPGQLVSREKVNELVGAFIAQISALWQQLTGRVNELTTALAEKTAECNQMRTTMRTDVQTLLDNLKKDVEERTGETIRKLQKQLTESNIELATLRAQQTSLLAQALAFSTKYSLPVGVAGVAALGLGLLGKAHLNDQDKKKRQACTALLCAGFAAVCFALFSTPAAAKALVLIGQSLNNRLKKFT